MSNRVYVKLCNPEQTIDGELRCHSIEGIWVYHGWAENTALYFYPSHRIIQIEFSENTVRRY
jgi:hypothetical protein